MSNLLTPITARLTADGIGYKMGGTVAATFVMVSLDTDMNGPWVGIDASESGESDRWNVVSYTSVDDDPEGTPIYENATADETVEYLRSRLTH